jgi:hydrogenase maturation protease
MPAERPPHPRPAILLIGIGNADRGDDGLGLAVACALSREAPEQVNIQRLSGNSLALLSLWQQADLVIIIDAVQSDAKPGTVYRIEAHHQPLPHTLFGSSSHSFGVAQAIELARSLQQLPPRLIIYGVEGHTFELGASLSPQVAHALPAVVARIRRDCTGIKAC